MFKNYFKTAWRNLSKNRAFSVINVTGLAIGMAAVLLIGIWVQNELNYDQFYSHSKDLYKLFNKTTGPGDVNVWDVTAGPAAKALEQNFPEVKNAARMYWPIDRLFTYGDKHVKSSGNDVDKPFLQMFDFPVISGNANHAMDDNNSIVLTKSLARKLFGNENPVNKIITVDNKELYKVTAVIKDLPANTDFNFTYLVPLSKEEQYSNTWTSFSYYTYVQLQPNVAATAFNKKIENLVKANVPDAKSALFVYPLAKMHLYSRFENGVPAGGKIEEVRLVVFIGILILLIACINFMNLSTARSQKRAKEVGVRKVIGAGRSSLIGQFLSESVLMAFVAGIIAVALVWIALPSFNNIMEKPFELNLQSPALWVSLVAFIIVTGLIAGSYPAFFLSAFKPVKVLKGVVNARQSFNPRKMLVVFQFSIAIVLIIATLIIYRQLHFVQERNAGYHIANLIEVPVEGDIEKNFTAIKTDLINSGAVTDVCRSGWSVTVDGSNSSGYSWEGSTPEQKDISFSLARTEGDFVNTLGLTLVDGRDINYARLPGDSNAVLLNETAVKMMGLKKPVGKYINSGNTTYTIAGVFKDFIIGSPYNEIAPMMVRSSKSWLLNMVLRLNANKNIQQNLKTASAILKKYNPAYPFSYHFVDEEYGLKFKDQQQTATLAALFGGLAIFISCLGLFGLASFMAESRVKEIGIRKVLGASSARLAALLSTDLIKLVGISCFIAFPVAWWLMSDWLKGYSYRISMSWGLFLTAGGMALLIALITVSFQALKAALANPVESLRSE